MPIQELLDEYGLNLYEVQTSGGEYLLQASSLRGAHLQAQSLGLLMDETLKDIRLAKRSEYKAIMEDLKHG
tara:strand:+ start:1412 stop:1624 length:213 start_codon:yes stop_codon:yes gene_type:complete